MLLTGTRASVRLNELAAQGSWQKLWHACSWANCFQHPSFVQTWFRGYRSVFEPLLIESTTKEGDLDGLLILAREKKSGLVSVAGTHHAEYHGWLSLAANGDFISRGLNTLRAAGVENLRFRYLRGQTLLTQLEASTWKNRLHVDFHLRPFADLRQTDRIKKSLAKKGNKSKLSRLKREGDVTLLRVQEASDFQRVLNPIIAQYDLRQLAVTGSKPFGADPFKRDLYRALFAANLLHVYVLKVDDKVAAAHLGPINGQEVSLGILSHDPMLARYAPGKLLLLHLQKQLADDGYAELDLTPGGDWKERFQDHAETVADVTVELARSRYWRRRTQETLKTATKKTLARVGIKPNRLRALRAKIRRPSAIAENAYQDINLEAAQPGTQPNKFSGEIVRGTSSEAISFVAGLQLSDQRTFLSFLAERAQKGSQFLSFKDQAGSVNGIGLLHQESDRVLMPQGRSPVAFGICLRQDVEKDQFLSALAHYSAKSEVYFVSPETDPFSKWWRRIRAYSVFSL